MTATTPESWQQMEALYHAALEGGDEEREALLSGADPEVRRVVDAMLLQRTDGGKVLDRPAWELATDLFEPDASRITPGRRIGPYRVDALIGVGGMGSVYRATDERLTRTVAIKVCSAQFSNRFERETKAIAALNHPNICQIYDVGPNYLVMEFVDGMPVVAKGQEPISVPVALRLATQIASAMEAAHAKGIIHRDLKPANILVSANGVAKLLDFGLAKQHRESGVATAPDDPTLSVSHAGMILGTPAFMSPEQAEGRPADARSDIFSFGTILYEMLSGRRAFPGTSAASVMGSIMHQRPEPISAPPALLAIVFKCLAKVPEERFQSATSLLAALEEAAGGVGLRPAVMTKRRWMIGAAIVCGLVVAGGAGVGIYRKALKAGPIDSIAVIPFSIQSKDAEADYISDGISESINNSLARLPNLKVIPNSVASNYKGKEADFQKIGQQLGVQSVLSGRIAQRGDSLTIDIELDDVRSGKQLWGQQYLRQVADLLTVQRDISVEVSQTLRSRLSASDQQKLTLGSTTNPDAYQLFLKGQHYTSKFTKDGFDKGIVYLNQAIALDPNYAEAYSELANNYINQDDWFIVPKEAAPKARAAAQKALALNETDVEAHVALAIEDQWYEWDWAASDREFKRALELDPEDADALGYYSWFLSAVGRSDEAIAQARQQVKIDPVATGTNGNYGSVLLFTHHWDEAIEQLRYAIDLNPNYWFDYLFLGRAYEQKGRLPEAIDTFQRGLKLDGNIELWGGLGHAYAASGNRVEAQKVLDHLNELAVHQYVAPYNVAIVYAGLGDKDKAFEWLGRAFDARSYLLVEYLNTDSRLDSLRGDARFSELHRRVGLPSMDGNTGGR